jgi:hypothetical protein
MYPTCSPAVIIDPDMSAIFPTPTSTPSASIRLPLHRHPARRNRTNNQRSRQPLPQFRSAIHQPLQRKVSKRNPESPEGNLVHGRVVDVVGAVEADDGAEGRPGAECAGAQGCDERGRGAGVDLLGAGEGEVGLDAVAEGDDGDLSGGGCQMVC